MLFNAVICLFSMLFFVLTDKNGFCFPPMLFLFDLVSCLMYAAGFGFMYLALQCGSYALTRLIVSLSGIIAISNGLIAVITRMQLISAMLGIAALVLLQFA